MPRPTARTGTKVADKSSAADERRGAQTLHRALDILQVFSTEQPMLSLAHISDSVGLTVPTTHRLLKALQQEQMVYYDPVAHLYSLGVGVMRLATVIINRDDISSLADGAMQVLRQLTNETVGLHWLVGGQRVCIRELTSFHPIRMSSGVGHVYPLHSGASGKAILAWLSPDEIASIVADASLHGQDGKRSQRDLLAELEKIRELGYAESAGETVSGAAAIAGPILNSARKPVGAINITGPSERFSAEVRDRFKPDLLSAVNDIMLQIGSNLEFALGPYVNHDKNAVGLASPNSE
jgi:DNA-binding IclR family transcriptional regulator